MERFTVLSVVLVLLGSCSSTPKPKATPKEEYQYSTGNKAPSH